MSGRTLDVPYGAKENDSSLMGYIYNTYETWKLGRAEWENEMLVSRDYLYATRTSTTQNGTLPFSNNTTVPKLTQLAEVLHANYMKSLFGIDPWFKWVGDTKEATTAKKVKNINAYIGTKLEQSQALNTFNLLVRDWIETGNCFAKIIWVNNAVYDPITKKQISGYVGPKIIRLSYLDIMFNIIAPSFYESPKIVKYLRTVGELYNEAETNPDSGITKEILDQLDKKNIKNFGAMTADLSSTQKGIGLNKDGFASYTYYNDSSVEVLEFTGDIFYNERLHRNRRITILNRQFMIRNEELPSWSGSDYLYHCAWRKRPDNCMGMGPLDNIIGLQYKIDKLENQRADVFDQFAYPPVFLKGDIEQQGETGAPGTVYISTDQNSAIEYLRPEPLALNADTQIAQNLQLMELMALTPPQTYGFRQPGEKTATEAGQLAEAGMLAYNDKVKQFETEFLEPLLNGFLEMARQNITGSDLVKVEDPTYNYSEFLNVTRADLMQVGKIKPLGSRYANNFLSLLQGINTMFNSGATQFIAPHISRVKVAKLLAELTGLEDYDIVIPDIGVVEDGQTQSVAMQVKQDLQSQAAASQAPPSLEPSAIDTGEQQPLAPQPEEGGDIL